jgi:UDP-2,3-diacylglucosamine pyrophosphatase LpxH
MRKIAQYLFRRPVKWVAQTFSSSPKRENVHDSLSKLFQSIKVKPGRKGVIIEADADDRFILFSDLHKGAKDGSDDFKGAESNYLNALSYYFEENYAYVNLGDSEELWENIFLSIKKHNKPSFEAEKTFLNANRFYKLFGNHDIYWNRSVNPISVLGQQAVYGKIFPVYEGLILQYANRVPIFMTHGHQGDGQSDGNAFSAWFVSNIWAPLQSFLALNPNTPSIHDELKTTHNQYMYEWAAKQENVILITGHTHQPIFQSMTHLERLLRSLQQARQEGNISAVRDIEKQVDKRSIKKSPTIDLRNDVKDCYYNTGCCCFEDGDITGIEIDSSKIRLIKWTQNGNTSQRIVLEEDDWATSI